MTTAIRSANARRRAAAMLAAFMLPWPLWAAPGDLTVSGQITAGSFSGDGSGLTNVPVAAHSHGADSSLVSTLVIGPVGTPTANGTALRDALANLPAPRDASNPYLVKLEPGTYDVGASTLSIPAFVDLEGSGKGLTRITGTVCGSGYSTRPATVTGNPDAAIRQLSIANTGGSGSYCAALAPAGSAVSHAEATASGASNTAIAVLLYQDAADLVSVEAHASSAGRAYGVFASSSDLTAHGGSFTAQGGDYAYGIQLHYSPTVLRAVEVRASGATETLGLYALGFQAVRVFASTIAGDSASVFVPELSRVVVAGSDIVGPAMALPASLTCTGTVMTDANGDVVATDADCVPVP